MSKASMGSRDAFALLDINQVRANPLQPRRRFDQEKLHELADSIRLHGVVQPVVVTREVEGYRLVVGERRWRASQLAGLTHIPALVQEMTPQNLLEVALIENLQRQDLNPVEEARAFQYLLREHQLTQEELARRLGCSRPSVANAIRLLGLPSSILNDLEAGVLSAGHARAVLALQGERAQRAAWHQIQDLQLSVRGAEDLVRKQLAQQAGPSSRAGPGLAPDWQQIQEQLAQQLNALVKIKPAGKNRGRIELHYRDQEQLEELMEALIAVTER
jgi:ParB family chromosome partitioning protein